MNPYESPSGSEDVAVQTSLWRSAVSVISLLISATFALVACYGVYNLHSRGWPHGWPQTVVILAALAMFVVAGLGFTGLGIGVRGHRRRMAFLGLGTIILSGIVYFTLFFVATYL